jgi:predicted phosphoadenosine phosphosulfate sulfurtransferase|tara:strand:+ start:46 stop:1251 length:1206 start_codon:yes stop_codon:yes gene_type:complete
MRVRKKEYSEVNVFDAGCERIRYLFNSFDNVIVNFSGGKDSTCILNMTLKIARELDRKVIVNFYDEEAIHPPTIEYVERVSKIKEVELNWYCLEFKHRNACSIEQPYFYGWDKNETHLWVREMPDLDCVISEHPNFERGQSWQTFSETIPKKSDGTTVTLTGVRTQESFRRMKAVSTKKNDNYISRNGHTAIAHPIYDMSSEDVWLCVKKFGWDYNRTYDIMNQTKLFEGYLAQRVCPPFGEESLRGLWMYSQCFPEMWHKMLNRCPGVATAWRYANTDIYGYGNVEKPSDTTYKKWSNVLIDSYETEEVILVKQNINSIIKRHYDKTNDKIPDEDPHPLTGTGWKFICKLIIKGDLRGRTGPTLENNAITEQKKLGINSFDEAVIKFGSEEYKNKRFKKK